MEPEHKLIPAHDIKKELDKEMNEGFKLGAISGFIIAVIFVAAILMVAARI